MVRLKLTRWPGVSITILFLLSIFLFFIIGTQLCFANRSSSAKAASVLLQEALYAEEIEGDINAAIKIYQQIIDDSSAQKNNIAQALYRQGLCYIKIQNEKQAQENFNKLITDFSDQTSIIAKVKPLLDEMSNADPATLMPPETLFYMEIGSPGKQIETILNMLKGSPLENPWALLEGNIHEGSHSQMGNIISGLLNESMMTELKKIRGMGVGITGIPQNDAPPAVVVMFPGKSDALKGLLQMALAMAGKPVESIEGMNCVEFTEGGGAAYDDTTAIMVTPLAYEAGQLEWSIKQYKGITNEPTLASSNKSFAQVSKQARQSNALTIWADINTFYSKLMEILPPDAIPDQMHMINGIVDFENIKDLIAFLTLEETGIAVEANVALNEGHNCIAYNMIRTPNLSNKGFLAVPPEAIGLVSFALSETDSIQAASVSKQLQSITGLDFGREIFANIEQVTLFLTPPENMSMDGGGQWNSAASSVGLAIISRNPQQTRQIINQMLTMAGLVSNSTGSNQEEQTSGKYLIELNNGMQLHCYQDQTNKTTVISMSPKVIDASIASIQSKKSALNTGPLQKALSTMSPNTSKILTLNLGSIIGRAMIDVGSEEETANIRDLLAQVAEGFKETTLQLRTNESLNNFNVRASINDLPPVGTVFAPMMHIGQIMSQMQQKTSGWGKVDATPVVFARTDTPPVIDGKAEDVWSKSQQIKLGNTIYSAASSDDDLSADYRAMWDKDNLYLFVNVRDDVLINDSVEFYYDDTIELFIDADNSKNGSYGENDYTFNINWDRNNPIMEERGQPYHNDGVKYALVTYDEGYRLEIMFSWATLGAKPFPGKKIGLDVHVNDDDDGGERETKFTWRDTEDAAWDNPQYFGTAELAGLVGWWKLDETEGDIAVNSSGEQKNARLVGEPKWLPSGGKIGGALEFDGLDDYVDTDNTSNLPTWTVCVWVKSPAAPSSEENPSGPVTREKNYQINWNHIMDEFRGAAGICIDGTWYPATFGELEANKWYYLTASYDGENLKAYKNGLLITNNTDPSGSADLEIETLKFGRHARDNDFFAGTIDDVRLYNYALDESEILALYKGK